MKNFTQISKIVILLMGLLFGANSYAQIGIGTIAPAPGSIFDVTSANKGILVPRVNITNLATIAPVTGGATDGLLVWSTNATNNGYHYWSVPAGRWIPLLPATATSNDWTLTGNAGTTPGTNFIGTTDNRDFEIFTNNTRKVDISANGNVGIGVAAPATNTVRLDVNGGSYDGIYGHSTNVGGYLGRETNITIGVPAQTLLGAGVYANNPTAGYTSLFGQSTGAATVAASINYSDVWISSYNYAQNGSATFNPPGLYSQLNVTNAALGGNKTAFSAYVNRTPTGNPGYTVGGTFTGAGRTEDSKGISATVFSNSLIDLVGGEFLAYNYTGSIARSQSWVANYFFGTDFKIIGTGAVSTIVEDENNKQRIMFAPEAPEVLFQDFGIGQLVNGIAQITIDPILSKNIFVDVNHPLKVFIQLEGDCNGVFVTNKSANGFTVKELQNGQSNVSFSYQIVANRIDRKETEFVGESKFQDLRFPEFDYKKKLQKVNKNSLMQTAENPDKKGK